MKSINLPTRREFLSGTAISLASLATACTSFSGPAKGTDKPNIIFILADDLGYGDLGCYGSRRIKTPHLDRLAAGGMRFTDFYSASAVCTPTRVSCLTGRYPLRFNVTRHFNDREMHLPAKMLTIPKLLKQAGYITKHVGKWHLGGLNVKHVANRGATIPGPLEHGFDHYLAMYEDPEIRRPLMLDGFLYRQGARHLVRDEKRVPPSPRHWTDYKVDESLSFVTEKHQRGQPFFLNLWFDTPHAPYEPAPAPCIDPYRSRAKGADLNYRSMVTHLDNAVGRIVAKLTELGIRENTLIIFTSDNGPAYQGSPGSLKGRKGDLHEGGIRMPAIASWPGRIKAGTICRELGHTNDLLPTFGAAARVPLPGEAKIDGQNLLPLLLGKEDRLDRGTMFWQIDLYRGNYQVVTDEKPKPYATEIARQGKWKLLAKDGKPLELFNLEEDRQERWNLIKTWPEVTTRLTAELKAWLAAERSPLAPKE